MALELRVVQNAEQLARVGAELVAAALATRGDAAVVAATGETPMGLYGELAAGRGAGTVRADGVTVFQLDEYLGLAPDDRRSLLSWMRRSFVEPLGVRDGLVVPLPTDGDLSRACAAFDRAIESQGGLDLAILGLGPNGHLGFNEPPSKPSSPTRVVELSAVTIEANARYWGGIEQVPPRAVTMGMRQLLAARTILLLVSGEGKRAITHRALEGPVGPEVPASLLREADSEVTILLDRAAWGAT